LQHGPGERGTAPLPASLLRSRGFAPLLTMTTAVSTISASSWGAAAGGVSKDGVLLLYRFS